MIAVLQRVGRASVLVEGREVGAIGKGVLVLLGVAREDGPEAAAWTAAKIADLRMFEDEAGKMNRSVREVGGAVLVVSQFTLCGDCRKGRRPSFDRAAGAEQGRAVYDAVVSQLRASGLPVATGTFGAHMVVALENDGPVTLIVTR